MLVLMSGLLPNPKLETSVLSISTRVSNELGAGRPQAARVAVIVVVVMAVTMGVVVGLIMILVHDIWGYAYSNEQEVVKYMAIMMPVLATSNFLDGMQSVLSGACRGCGWPKLGAFVNYIVGIPSAILLAFILHVGGKGLWMGIVFGLFVQVLSLGTITLCTNWEKEASTVKDRVLNLSLPVDMAS